MQDVTQVFSAQKIYDSCIKEYTTPSRRYAMLTRTMKGECSLEEFKENVRDYCNDLFSGQEKEIEQAVCMLVENLLGYSILTPLIEDKEISDIDIYAWDKVTVKKAGKRMIAPVSFASKEDYDRFIQSVLTKNKVNASTRHSIARFSDSVTSKDFKLRFTLVTPFLTNPPSYILMIRKIAVNFPEVDDLINAKMLTREQADIIIDMWNQGSLLICGAMSAGKTTLLNALKEQIPTDKAVVLVQQTDELTPKRHPLMFAIHSYESDSNETDLAYGLKELTQACLTMDVDRIIVGEIKDEEARYILNASYTGTICGATIHANSSQTGLDKLVDYAISDKSPYTKAELLQMLTGFKCVVFLENYKVKEISEIIGIANGKVDYRRIC